MRSKSIIILLTIIGGFGVCSTTFLFKERFFPNLLLFYSLFFLIGWGSIFILALEKSLNLKWTIPFKKISENLSFLGLLHIPLQLFILFKLDKFFVWASKSQNFHPFVEKKIKLYLNQPFFIFRGVMLIIFYLICFFLYNKYKSFSDKTDRHIKIFSPLMLILFAISITIFSFDYISSLEPLWYSDIIGVYFFASSYLLILNMIAFICATLKRNNLLNEIKEKNLYNIGGMIFAFTVFWAYICFAQYMLIWYANLGEEVFFYKKRGGTFLPLWLYLALSHFVLPFFLLITKKSKSSLKVLLTVSLIYFSAIYVDLYLYIFPSFFKKVSFGVPELSFILFFASLSFLILNYITFRKDLLPLEDPLLKEVIEKDD